jgi:ADP-ribose pyrophosphatase YjhB (NUDIX family)
MSGEPNLPRVGCGAAVLKGGKLLLVRRKRAPEAGHWGLPGGKVDPFETVPAAVAREIAEELGIRIFPEVLLCVVDQIDRECREHWIAPVYLIDRFEGDPALREPEALAEIGWFPLNDMPVPLTEATRQALQSFANSR